MISDETRRTIQDRVDRFLKSRKSPDTRVYAQAVIKYLLERKEAGDEWIRAKEIHDAFVKSGEIPHATTLFRLLDDLYEFSLVDRVKCKKNIFERGKAPVFYRVIIDVPRVMFMDRDELLDELWARNAEIIDYSINLRYAIEMLEKEGVSNAKEKVRKRAQDYRRLVEKQIESDLEDLKIERNAPCTGDDIPS